MIDDFLSKNKFNQFKQRSWIKNCPQKTLKFSAIFELLTFKAKVVLPDNVVFGVSKVWQIWLSQEFGIFATQNSISNGITLVKNPKFETPLNPCLISDDVLNILESSSPERWEIIHNTTTRIFTVWPHLEGAGPLDKNRKFKDSLQSSREGKQKVSDSLNQVGANARNNQERPNHQESTEKSTKNSNLGESKQPTKAPASQGVKPAHEALKSKNQGRNLETRVPTSRGHNGVLPPKGGGSHNHLWRFKDSHWQKPTAQRCMMLLRTVTKYHEKSELRKSNEVYHIDKNGQETKGIYFFHKLTRYWDGDTRYPGKPAWTWVYVTEDGRIQNGGFFPAPEYWGPTGPGRGKNPHRDGPDDPSGGGRRPKLSDLPPLEPAGDNYQDRVQQTNLQDTHNSNNLSNLMSKQGNSGDIGGVGLEGGQIEGLFDGLAANWEFEHVFFVPGEKQPFSDNELKQIIRELAVGIFTYDSTPYFSLHFNFKRELFPVLHPCYQNTLVGEVIGMLDYLMKGFLNGGYFDKEGIERWFTSNRENTEELRECKFDLHEYCQKNRHLLGPGVEYMSLLELLWVCENRMTEEQQSNFANEDPILKDHNNFTSAFRIIATQGNFRKGENLFYLDGSFDIRYDLNIDPVYEEHLRRHRSRCKNDPQAHQNLSASYKMMSELIGQIMPRLPICSKYFEQLKVIHFLSYYFKTLKAHSKLPLLPLGANDQSRRASPLFPSLPIRTVVNYPLELSINKIAEQLTAEQKAHLVDSLRNRNPDPAVPFPDDLIRMLKYASKIANLVNSRDFRQSIDLERSRQEPGPGIWQVIKNAWKDDYSSSNIAQRRRQKLEHLDYVKRASENIDFQIYAVQILEMLHTLLNPSDEQREQYAQKAEHFQRESELRNTSSRELTEYRLDIISKIASCDRDGMESNKREYLAKLEEIVVRGPRIHREAEQFRALSRDWTAIADDPAAILDTKTVSIDPDLSFHSMLMASDLTREKEGEFRRVVGGCGLELASKPLQFEPLGEQLLNGNFAVLQNTNEGSWMHFKSPTKAGYAFKLSFIDYLTIHPEENLSSIFELDAPRSEESANTEALLQKYLEGEFDTSMSDGIKLGDLLKEQPEIAQLYLMRAAQQHTVDQLRLLHDLSVDFSLQDDKGFNAVHHAVFAKSILCTEWLLDKHNELGEKLANDGSSALMLAVQSGDIDLVFAVLDIVPFHKRSAQMQFVLKWGGADLQSELLPDCHSVPSRFRYERKQIIDLGWFAAAKRHLNTQSHNGMTPLYCAVQRGHVEIAQLLLAFDAYIDTELCVDRGVTPLCLAAKLGNGKMCKTLLGLGANLSATTEDGWGPLHLAIAAGQPDSFSVFMNFRAETERWDGIESFVNPMANNANKAFAVRDMLNARVKTGKTPLHIAARYDQWGMARELLEQGADPTLSGWDGETFFLTALFHDSLQTVQGVLDNVNVLNRKIDSGGKKFCLLDCPNRMGQDPLQAAQEAHFQDIAERIDLEIRKPYTEPILGLLGYWHAYRNRNKQWVSDGRVPQGFERLQLIFENGWHWSHLPELLKQYPDLTRSERTRLLQIAAKNGRGEFVSYLLFLGEDKVQDLPDEVGRISLHYSAQFDEVLQVRWHLADHPQHVILADQNGMTPAAIAASHNSVETLRVILGVLKNEGEGLEHLYKGQHLLLAAIHSGFFETAELILDEMPKPNQSLNSQGQNAAHIVAGIGDLKMLKLLRERGVRLGARDESGQTPLHMAIATNRDEIVQYLLGLEPQLDHASDLVHFAAESNRMQITLDFLARGFPIDALHPVSGETPLFHALRHQQHEIFASLLAAGANYNQCCGAWTPLLLAAHLGLTRELLSLLQKGADTSATSKGQTALQLAVASGHFQCAQILLQRGEPSSNQQMKACLEIAKKSGRPDLEALLQGKSAQMTAIFENIKSAIGSNDLSRFKALSDHWGLNPFSGRIYKEDCIDLPFLHLAYVGGGVPADQNAILRWLTEQPQVDFQVRAVDGSTFLHLAAKRGDLPTFAQMNWQVRDGNGCTPLHYFATCGNIATLEKACELAGDIHALDDQGQTPLFHAISANITANVEHFLKLGADPNLHNKMGVAPLHFALVSNNEYLAELLINNGADVDLRTRDELRSTPLHIATESSNESLVRLLIHSGAEARLVDGLGRVPLHSAANGNNLEIVRQLAQRSPTNLSDDYGWTAVHLAAKKGNVEILRYLARVGHSLDPSTYGKRHPYCGKEMTGDFLPIELAALAKRTEAVNFLKPTIGNLSLDEQDKLRDFLLTVTGAKPRTSNRASNRRVENLRSTTQTRELDGAVRFALQRDQVDSLRGLVQAGWNINNFLDSMGRSTLHVAARHGALHCTAWLLQKGASPTRRSLDDQSPLSLALIHGHTRLARMLISRADEFDMGKLHIEHRLLHSAARRGDLEMGDLLLEYDIQMSACDSNGKTPLHWALLERQLSFARLLLLAGADLSWRDGFGRSCESLLDETSFFSKEIRRCAQICRDSEDLQESLLHTAVRIGDSDLLAVALLRIDVNYPDVHNRRPLHLAAAFGQTNAARSLILTGANLEVRDDENKTPLWSALVIAKNLPLVELLLQGGAQGYNLDGKDTNLVTVAKQQGLPDQFCAEVEKLVDLRQLRGKAPANSNLLGARGTQSHQVSYEGASSSTAGPS